MDWMRNKGLAPSDDADGGLFEKLGSVPISRRTPEERKGDVDAAMNWMRNPQDEYLDPTGEFTRVDQLLPKKGQKPEAVPVRLRVLLTGCETMEFRQWTTN